MCIEPIRLGRQRSGSTIWGLSNKEGGRDRDEKDNLGLVFMNYLPQYCCILSYRKTLIAYNSIYLILLLSVCVTF